MLTKLALTDHWLVPGESSNCPYTLSKMMWLILSSWILLVARWSCQFPPHVDPSSVWTSVILHQDEILSNCSSSEPEPHRRLQYLVSVLQCFRAFSCTAETVNLLSVQRGNADSFWSICPGWRSLAKTPTVLYGIQGSHTMSSNTQLIRSTSTKCSLEVNCLSYILSGFL